MARAAAALLVVKEESENADEQRSAGRTGNDTGHGRTIAIALAVAETGAGSNDWCRDAHDALAGDSREVGHRKRLDV